MRLMRREDNSSLSLKRIRLSMDLYHIVSVRLTPLPKQGKYKRHSLYAFSYDVLLYCFLLSHCRKGTTTNLFIDQELVTLVIL